MKCVAPYLSGVIIYNNNNKVYFFSAVAVYTYYRSLSQENRLKLSGKHKQRKQARRRRERLLRVRILFPDFISLILLSYKRIVTV